MREGLQETTQWIARCLSKSVQSWDDDVDVTVVDGSHIRLEMLDEDDECVAVYTLTVRRRN